jgi:beta-glucosidase-like glycosyl hydrolase
MAAVNNGTLSEERINQSVRRILKLRKKINRAL